MFRNSLMNNHARIKHKNATTLTCTCHTRSLIMHAHAYAVCACTIYHPCFARSAGKTLAYLLPMVQLLHKQRAALAAQAAALGAENVAEADK